MNRRDLMKGIAALPVAAAAYNVSCRRENTDGGAARTPSDREKNAARSPRTKLFVALRGPFAVVVQSKRKYRIQAFVPVQDGHYFFLNSAQQAGSSYSLSLPDDGLNFASQIDIDGFTDFKDFSVHTKKWELGDYYISVDLPCPSDMLTDEIDDATFQSGATGGLPLAHILEYDVSDVTQIKLKGDGISDQSPTPNSGVYVFDLQVGLPLNTSNSLNLAVDYYNKSLLPCFPDVKGKELKSISPPSHSAPAAAPPVARAAGQRTLPFVPPATDVECKNGGLLISFPQ
ncbi:MAG: hypothetical protein ACJ71W_14405 [Terriglobales bacterium]